MTATAPQSPDAVSSPAAISTSLSGPLDFSLPAVIGGFDDTFSLASVRGKAVVVYFYPKDSTPGCTTEAQDFRTLMQDFAAADAVIVGISRDSLKSHRNFAEKQCLPFPLLSDADEAVCNLFGVIKMKNMYGKQVRGIERSTFLLNRDGTLAREWRGVKVTGHAQEVLAAAQAL